MNKVESFLSDAIAEVESTFSELDAIYAEFTAAHDVVKID